MHILARAWPKVLRHVPSCHWLLCGPEDAWLNQAVWPLLDGPARERVHTTGPLSGRQVFEHLAAADLHVNPSLCESLNMVTVEAASVGVPTVCSDGAGVAHWLIGHDAGGVVGAGDPEALARAVVEALRDEACLSRWRRNASALVKEFYPERIAGCLLELLRAAGAPLGATR
jgi:glycosyltransferase involved in cell wall biosynthesis